MTTATIIPLFGPGARNTPSTVAQTETSPFITEAFQALPFVSGSVNEAGWPKKLWCPETIDKNGDRFGNAGKYAQQTVMVLCSSTRYQSSVMLSRLLETIIETEAIRMARGGKGSRSLSGPASAFLDRLSHYIGLELGTGGF